MKKKLITRILLTPKLGNLFFIITLAMVVYMVRSEYMWWLLTACGGAFVLALHLLIKDIKTGKEQ
ncbi:hypothetical protein FIP36_16770 [Salmonella enterica]|nr:hypothetical protein [Salmonella enterica]EEX1005155.1 hypothetical protein [Escherichia coli]